MEVLKVKAVKIRKPRDCFGCCGKLNKGDAAHIQTNTDMGCIYDVTLCVSCNEKVKDMDSGDFFGEGDLK